MRITLAHGLAALLAVSTATTFWLLRENQDARRAIGKAATENCQLREERDQIAAEAAHYRQHLRQQTLERTVRSPTELLALLPARFPQGNWQPAETSFEDCWFEADDGLRLHGWHLPHPQPRAAILVLHGNAGNLAHRAPFLEKLRAECQVSLFACDYRGYGRSEGAPTFEGLMLDARAARQAFAERAGIPGSQIVLFGESLGGAIAIQLAADDGARALVLDGTFASLQEVASTHYPAPLARFVVGKELNSAAAIANYHGPLLQLHGNQDRTVPLASAERLFTAAHEPKSFVRLPGHDHNTPRPHEFFAALRQLLERLGE
jgi:fermentation-respiration switch protein FrsA (DUF1100 family)